MKAFKKIFFVFLRVGISVTLLVVLFKVNNIDIHDLADSIRHADKALLFTGFFIFVLSYILCFVRWIMLLKAANINVPFKRALVSYAGGIFFSNILPSTIGGDFMRTADLAMYTKQPKEVIATVLLDRLSGYVGMVIVISLAFLAGWRFIHDTSVFISVGIIILLLVMILFVLFNKFIYERISKFLGADDRGRILEAIKNLHHEIHIFRTRKKVIFNNLAVSLLVQTISPVSIYFIGLSLGIKINLLYYFIFLPVIGAILLLPVSIAGIGLREYLFKLYFGQVGIVPHLAVTMSLLSFSFILIYGSLGGIIYVLTVRHRRIQSAEQPAFEPR